MSAYQLGDFEFLSLDFPGLFKERPLVLDRPGVEGSAVWLTGKRGKLFTVRSTVDCRDLTDATMLLTEYRDSIGGDPVDMVWDNQAVTTEETKIVVLDVRTVPGRVFRMAGATPGLRPPSLAWLEVEWDLILVKVEAE